MQIFLDDSQCRKTLLPFTYTRHVADIRIGILTIREKWEILTGAIISTSEKDIRPNTIKVSANLLPSKHNIELLLKGNNGNEPGNISRIEYPWHIFQLNDQAIRDDFELLTAGRNSQPLSNTNKLTGNGDIFLEEGASVEHSMLNTSTGPIYIGKNAMIMEGNLVRGPFSIAEGSVLKMGSRIYGATTIGPYCTAGGEIKNSVLFGYSNKAHDGYLGDSVIGAWCNLGAGTSNSNVRNNAGEVKYLHPATQTAIAAGNKGGLLMGDYSRCAINTSFNTGTTVGVCCNIFGQELTEKYIANFSWGRDRYDFNKAITDINNWMNMKGKALTTAEKETLHQLYHSNQY